MDKEKHCGQKTESGTSGDAVKNLQEKDIDKSLIPEQQAASELTLLNSNKQEQKTGVETAAAVAENIKEEEVSSSKNPRLVFELVHGSIIYLIS